MDLRRADRNLRLALDGEGEREQQDVESSSLADRDMVETQVPGAVGFSSSPVVTDARDEVFVSTQIQSRLDEAMQEEALQDELKRFKYDDGEKHRSIRKVNVPKKPRVSKKPQQKSLGDFGETKAGQLLKRLSGRHKKVKEIVESQRNQGRKRTKTVSHYDTYNSEEWRYLHRKLLEHFPQGKPDDVKQVFYHLYGPDQPCGEKDLWAASQVPPETYSPVSATETNVKPTGVRNCEEVKVLTLSQVLSDNGDVEPEYKEDYEDDDSTVPDSTEEASICIPVEDVDRVSTQFYTPRTSLKEEIIDLTQESFKVVKSLISPLKDEQTPLVQVPATRTSTILTYVKFASKSVKMMVSRDQIVHLKEKLSHCYDIDCADEQVIFSDTELELDEQLPAYLYRKPQQSPRNKVILSNSHFATQSAQKLRQRIKAIGLKPCRSKSQMIASLEAASQVLDSSATEHEQRHLIYDNLTNLVYSCPSLLERIYTFQPIPLTDLLARLTEANPFIDQVDEPTIRSWADRQGICLTSSS